MEPSGQVICVRFPAALPGCRMVTGPENTCLGRRAGLRAGNLFYAHRFSERRSISRRLGGPIRSSSQRTGFLCVSHS